MIQVLDKAAGVMRLVAAREGLTFTDIRRETGMNKATLSHLLKSLLALGWLERGADGGHAIGPEVARLARPRLARSTLHGIAETAVRELAEEVRETVTVALLRQGERYNLAKASVAQSVSVDARVEQRFSPYDTATGRLLLAHASPAERQAVIAGKGLPSDWPVVTSEADLESALTAIRAAGQATRVGADGQAEAVALPVRDPDGAVVAAIGLAAPRYRLDADRRPRLIAALTAARARMEQALALTAGATSPTPAGD